MDYKSIEQLIKVMSESKLTSLHIEGDGISIKMSKNEIVEPLQDGLIMKEDVKNIKSPSKRVINDEEEIVEVKEETEFENGKVIVSPIVGTFYSSSSPEAENFVKIGSQVKKGDVICIIEAMKLMNEIESDVDGEIIDILVNNGDMVEYGQKLFIIKES